MRKMSQRKVAVTGVVVMMVFIIGLLLVPGLAANGNGANVGINLDDAECSVFISDPDLYTEEYGTGIVIFTSIIYFALVIPEYIAIYLYGYKKIRNT